MGNWHGDERRRSDRCALLWPVVVELGERRLLAETVDVSCRGAKIRLSEPVEPGTPARLCLRPVDQRPLDLDAMVWRVDPRGIVFLFLEP
jgi:PilZ domain